MYQVLPGPSSGPTPAIGLRPRTKYVLRDRPFRALEPYGWPVYETDHSQVRQVVSAKRGWLMQKTKNRKPTKPKRGAAGKPNVSADEQESSLRRTLVV